MIDLNMILNRYPAPHPGVIIEQGVAPEGWLAMYMYASNLADLPDSKREDTITWAFDVCQKITAAGNPIQFIIRDE